MMTNEYIDKYFSRNRLLDSLTKYQLYYQISLSNYVYTALDDPEATIDKLNEFDLKLDTGLVFRTILEIINNFSDQKDFEDKFDYHLRLRALSQSLYDYIAKDKKLHNPQAFADTIHAKINQDEYFTDVMKEQFDMEYNNLYSYWESIISESGSEKIKQATIELLQ